MKLKEFKTGWQERFEPNVEALLRLFPATEIISIKKEFGLLRIKMAHLDKDIQYVLDCVTYKIERESAITCEGCGAHGSRRTELIPEQSCLCWKCYALEVDALETIKSQTQK